MDQFYSDVIKEEQNEFNCDTEEEKYFYKEAHFVSCGSNMELLSIKDEKSIVGQNTLNDNKVGECYKEPIHATDINEKKDASCTHVVKEESKNENDDEMSESEKNQNTIKHEIDDGLHSELMIKEEDALSKNTVNDLESDPAYSSLKNETKDYLTGDESFFARKPSTIISSSNESNSNEFGYNLKVENKPMNKKVKKNISNKIHNKEHSARKRFKHLNTKREKLFKCDVCEKSFLQKHHLIRHTFSHSADRPFKCDNCEKSFSRKQHLIQHNFTHTGERPFRCDKCEKSFTTKQHLIRHTFTHIRERPFKCDKCEKSFTTKQNLITHTFFHTGERPFKCDKCEKTFSAKENLIRHTFTHSEERPFKCGKCQKSFLTKQNLIMHTFTHIEEKPLK